MRTRGVKTCANKTWMPATSTGMTEDDAGAATTHTAAMEPAA